MDAARPLVQHVAVLLSSQLITSVLGFLTVLLLPVYLGDAGLGELAFAQSVCTVLGAVAVAGTNLYIAREVAADRQRLPQLVAAGLVTRAPIWGVLVLAIWTYFSVRGTSRQAMVVLGVLFAVTLVNILNGVLTSALQGLEQMRWRSVSAVATSLVVLAAGLPLLLLTHSPVWFCVALLAGAVVGLGINATYFAYRRTGFRLPGRAAYIDLAVGAAPFLALAVSQGLYSQIDTIFMGLMTSDAAVGWFAAAARLSTAVLLVPVVMTSALLPVLTRLGASQPTASADALRRSMQAVLLLTMPMAAGLSAIGQPLFAFLHYPAAFSRSIPILVVLSASWVVTAVVMVLASAVVAQGRQRAWAIASVAMLVWFGLLNLVLIPLAARAWSNGGIGAAIANLAGELAFVAVALVVVREPVLRKRDISYYARVAIATAAMAVTVRMTPLSLPLLVALGGLAYGAFSLLLRTLTFGEMRLVLQLVRRDRSAFPTPVPASEPLAS
jgi:O-antigen/teichoic acid export membrane protein